MAHGNSSLISEALLWGFREKGYLLSEIWGEGSFIFRDLGRKHNFWGGFGSREQGAENKHFRELGRKVIFLSGSRPQRTPLGGLISGFFFEFLRVSTAGVDDCFANFRP